MKCYRHRDSDAIAVCTECLRPICGTCMRERKGQVVCSECSGKVKEAEPLAAWAPGKEAQRGRDLAGGGAKPAEAAQMKAAAKEPAAWAPAKEAAAKEKPAQFNRNALIILVAINFFAGLYGFYYYAFETGQLFSQPIYYWLFIPDSAIAVMLAVVVLSGAIRSGLLDFIASVYLVKYGAWTVFVMLLNSELYLAPQVALVSIFLFILPHAGMVLESILTIPRRVKSSYLPLALALFLLNDYLDYFIGIHTRIPEKSIELVAVFSLLLTLFACVILFNYASVMANWKPVARLRGFFGR